MIEIVGDWKHCTWEVWSALLTLLMLNEGDLRVFKTHQGFAIIATDPVLDDASALFKGFALRSRNSLVLLYPFG